MLKRVFRGASMRAVGQEPRIGHRAFAVLVLLTVSVSALFGLVTSAQAVTVKPVKIMPLGDSITHGGATGGGYRLGLEDKLIAGSYDFNFVGTQTNGNYPALESRRHEGHPS